MTFGQNTWQAEHTVNGSNVTVLTYLHSQGILACTRVRENAPWHQEKDEQDLKCLKMREKLIEKNNIKIKRR